MALSVFLLALSIVTVVKSQCPADWLLHEESCYAFGEIQFSWPDAQEVCRSFGAKLAEIETAEENNFLKTTARTTGRYYWIGGTDMLHEGHWVWASTKEPIYPFSDWHPGHPEGGAAQACLLIDSAFDYQWNDYLCDRVEYFICESGLQETVVG